MHSVAKPRPMHCAILAKELDTWIWAQPRRSISHARSSVARRRPGVAIRFKAGNGVDMSLFRDIEPIAQPSLRAAPLHTARTIVIPGLDPGIHEFLFRGWPGQARP